MRAKRRRPNVRFGRFGQIARIGIGNSRPHHPSYRGGRLHDSGIRLHHAHAVSDAELAAVPADAANRRLCGAADFPQRFRRDRPPFAGDERARQPRRAGRFRLLLRGHLRAERPARERARTVFRSGRCGRHAYACRPAARSARPQRHRRSHARAGEPAAENRARGARRQGNRHRRRRRACRRCHRHPSRRAAAGRRHRHIRHLHRGRIDDHRRSHAGRQNRRQRSDGRHHQRRRLAALPRHESRQRHRARADHRHGACRAKLEGSRTAIGGPHFRHIRADRGARRRMVVRIVVRVRP